jgi:hypothetical protein
MNQHMQGAAHNPMHILSLRNTLWLLASLAMVAAPHVERSQQPQGVSQAECAHGVMCSTLHVLIHAPAS